MDAAEVLRKARRRAHLSQRELASRSGLLQPAIARIESGRSMPRLDTFERLLKACGQRLEVHPRPGAGVDRTMIRRLLALTPRQRLDLAVEEARNLERLATLADTQDASEEHAREIEQRLPAARARRQSVEGRSKR